jgi:hypothetical protein
MIKVNISFCLATITIFFTGCTMHGTNISKSGKVTIERISSEKVFIPWADVYQDGNNLLVTGVVERRYPSTGIFTTHIDIKVIDSTGQIVNERRTKDIYVPSGLWTRFNLNFCIIPPENAIIKAICHSGKHN